MSNKRRRYQGPPAKEDAEPTGTEARNFKEVTTESGFTCRIDAEALDDWTFAKMAARASEGGPGALNCCLYMVEHMLSSKDATRLEEHVKDQKGRVRTSRMIKEIEDIFSGVNNGKNS